MAEMTGVVVPVPTESRNRSFSGPPKIDTTYQPGLSTLRLQQQGRQLIHLLGKHQVPVPDFLKAHNKSVDMSQEQASETWKHGASLADLVFSSALHSKSAKHNMILSATALLEASQIAIPHDILNLRLEPVKLTEMPNELIRKIAYHTAVEMAPYGPTGDGYTKVGIYRQSAWYEFLRPLSACKDLYYAGKEQVFYAYTGAASVSCSNVNPDSQLQVGQLVQPTSPSARICANLRELELTLPMGEIEFDIQAHNHTIESSTRTLASLAETCPNLKRLDISLRTLGANQLHLPSREEHGEHEAVETILSSLWRLVEKIQTLRVADVSLGLCGASGDMDWGKPERYIQEGPWNMECECEPRQEKCMRCSTKEWAYTSDAWILYFGSLSYNGEANLRRRIVEVEEEVDEEAPVGEEIPIGGEEIDEEVRAQFLMGLVFST